MYSTWWMIFMSKKLSFNKIDKIDKIGGGSKKWKKLTFFWGPKKVKKMTFFFVIYRVSQSDIIEFCSILCEFVWISCGRGGRW